MISFQTPPSTANMVITPEGTYVLQDNNGTADDPYSAAKESISLDGYLVIPLKKRPRYRGDAGLSNDELVMPIGPTLYYARKGFTYWNSFFGKYSARHLLVNHAAAVLAGTAWSDIHAYAVVKTKGTSVSGPAPQDAVYLKPYELLDIPPVDARHLRKE